MADMTLMEFLRSILFDDEARQEFAENPEKALDEAGLEHLSADDVHDALALMQEDNQEADFSRGNDTGGNEINIAAPEPVNHHHDGGDGDGESAVEYINRYITNNYVDDRDTNIDNSVNQQIDTGGGDFDQDIDIDSTVASGDGAVAAGDDIEDSNVVSGDGNTVGDGNIDGDGNVTGDGNSTVNGDGNTTSFGDGDATSAEINGDVSLDDGSSFAIGGSSSTESTDNSVEDSFNDNSEHSVEDSFNESSEYTDNSDNSTSDSFNSSDDDNYSSEYSDDDNYTDNSSSTDDSFNRADYDHNVDVHH
jgi:hypothetical protein